MLESFGASGELSGFDFPKLLIYLNDNRFDGKLIVNITEFSKSIFVAKGLIAYVVSNDPSDSLDSVIIKYGMLSSEKFKDAVEKAKIQQKSVAKYLIENSLLSSEDLIQASGLQIKEVIKNLIIATDFAYFLKKDSTPENIPNQKVSPYQVTFDAFMNMEDMDWIYKQLGSSKRIFVQSEDFVERYKNIFYSEDTDLVVTRIDGKTDVDALIKNTGLDGNQVKKILASLYVMNMLKLVSDSPLDMAEPVLMKKSDTDTQQIQAELARKRSAQPALPTEKFPVPPRPPAQKPEEITYSQSIEKPVDINSAGERELVDQPYNSDLGKGEKIKGRPQRFNELDDKIQPVSASTDHYMKILERQRKKSSRLTIFTLILLILFGLTAAFYIFVYQKNIESDLTIKKTNNSTSIPKSDANSTVKTVSDVKPSVDKNKPGTTIEKTPLIDDKNTLKPNKTIEKPIIANKKNIGTMMAAGNYSAAAVAWKEMLKGSAMYTISVEIACSRESITKIYNLDRKLEYLFILPKMVKNSSCFRVCWGQFPDLQTAKSKIGTLPQYYKNQSPVPEPVQLKTIL